MLTRRRKATPSLRGEVVSAARLSTSVSDADPEPKESVSSSMFFPPANACNWAARSPPPAFRELTLFLCDASSSAWLVVSDSRDFPLAAAALPCASLSVLALRVCCTCWWKARSTRLLSFSWRTSCLFACAWITICLRTSCRRCSKDLRSVGCSGRSLLSSVVVSVRKWQTVVVLTVAAYLVVTPRKFASPTTSPGPKGLPTTTPSILDTADPWQRRKRMFPAPPCLTTLWPGPNIVHSETSMSLLKKDGPKLLRNGTISTFVGQRAPPLLCWPNPEPLTFRSSRVTS
mmetsp:Transcript_49031/g.88178  ORF Transcript_49031/g.88178 Transcript_49031/m.88178 type:complete len:288 (-) Transcript_49031:617-1480(-)